MWPALTELVRSYAAYYRAKVQRIENPEPPREGPAAWITAISTFLAAVLAGVAAYVFWGQLDEMQSEQRAWISVSGDPIVSGLSSNANGVSLTVSFVVKNSGKNPAVNAFVNIDANADRRPDINWQNDVCGQPLQGFGSTVFSGDGAGIVQTATVKGIPAFKIIWPFITACVVYRDAVTGKWHHTPYIFRVSMNRIALKPNRGCCSIILSDLPIDGKDLFIAQWPVTLRLPD